MASNISFFEPTNYFIQHQRVTNKDFRSNLEHIASLEVNSEPGVIRNSGIICILGPACMSVEILHKMFAVGMNFTRLNFSHGTVEYHSNASTVVREAVETFLRLKSPMDGFNGDLIGVSKYFRGVRRYPKKSDYYISLHIFHRFCSCARSSTDDTTILI